MNVPASRSLFHTMHQRGEPLILPNAWDAGSAKSIAAAGARAIATSSYAVSEAWGYSDGEQLPRELCWQVAAHVIKSVSVPVTVDLESGYGQTREEIGWSILQLDRLGAAGCNIEDSDPSSRQMRPVVEQSDRLSAAREAAPRENGLFINARTDLFLNNDPARHGPLIGEAIARAKAYADAGADGFFAPGLVDPGLIAKLADGISLPLNIMVMDLEANLGPLASAGVSRISFGPAPYVTVMNHLREASTKLIEAAHG